MAYSITVEGPLSELAGLREEVIAQFDGQIAVSDLQEVDEDILSPGKLGDSPVVSFVIQFAADLSAAGAVATAAAIKTLISKRNRKVRTKESKDPDENE
jgi:hypothetical protein